MQADIVSLICCQASATMRKENDTYLKSCLIFSYETRRHEETAADVKGLLAEQSQQRSRLAQLDARAAALNIAETKLQQDLLTAQQARTSKMQVPCGFTSIP